MTEILTIENKVTEVEETEKVNGRAKKKTEEAATEFGVRLRVSVCFLRF